VKNREYPLYEVDIVRNLKELIDRSADRFIDLPAFAFERKKELVSISYRRFQSDVRALGAGLLVDGSAGCNVAVVGENSYEWILTYFAVTNIGRVIVPLDKELNNAEIKNLLDDSGAETLVFSPDYADVARYMSDNAASVKNYVNMDQIQELIYKGLDAIQGGQAVAGQEIDENATAALLYTSGTTGKPKGVMLSHRNLASDAVAACQHVGIFGSNMLVLPLHHSFGFVAAVCSMLLKGSEICISSSLKRTVSDLTKFKPANMFLVPLFVETFYKKIWETAKKQGKDKLLKRMIGVSNVLLKAGIDVRRVLFGSIISSLGGNLKLIVSGGAPLDVKYVEGFRDIGINILNGYGITECSPIVSVNRNEYYRDGSVGLVLPCCEVRISAPDEDGHGDIYVKGDNVMLGYYGNEQATSDTFDGEWFITGDIGYMDEDGFLYVSGRKKNLIILNNGKNVYPEEIEEELLHIEYIKEAVVYAEDNTIIAEVFLDTEKMPDCAALLDQDIINLNKTLPIYKNIGKTRIRDVEFPKTTTKKIKRA